MTKLTFGRGYDHCQCEVYTVQLVADGEVIKTISNWNPDMDGWTDHDWELNEMEAVGDLRSEYPELLETLDSVPAHIKEFLEGRSEYRYRRNW